jgi:hypothetical protein
MSTNWHKNEKEQEANVPGLRQDHHDDIQVGLSASLVPSMPSAVSVFAAG